MNVKEVSIGTAKQHLDDKSAVFIDIRDKASFMSGHIPGALNLSDQNIEEYIQSADKSQLHIICCYHGHSSMGAASFFQGQGFEKVFSMTGGFTGWGTTYPMIKE